MRKTWAKTRLRAVPFTIEATQTHTQQKEEKMPTTVIAVAANKKRVRFFFYGHRPRSISHFASRLKRIFGVFFYYHYFFSLLLCIPGGMPLSQIYLFIFYNIFSFQYL